MKRLVTMAACLAMLTFTGCANGILGGGLFSNGCNSGCNSSPSLLGGGGLLSDGPIRQFFRGDACDSCNSAAGQVTPGYGVPAYGAPTCDACGGAVSADPYAIPSGAFQQGGFPSAQPTTSFYPSDAGVSLGQPLLDGSSVSPIDPGAIYGGAIGGSIDSLTEPPNGLN